MSKLMKFMGKSSAAIIAATMLFSAAPASAQQATSVDQILQKIRSDSAKVQAENAAREQKFRSRRDQQSSLLSQARGELSTLEGRARSVQSKFDGNKSRISGLEGQLSQKQGDFREVFGLARSKAGEFKAILDASMISAEDPGRTEVLGRISESKALPSTDDLNQIWMTMLDEIQKQRQVSTFNAPVANVDDGAEQSVTRVGPFAAFTTNGGQYLKYSPAATEGGITLQLLPKQPADKSIVNAAKNVLGASAGQVVYAPMDPTRGSLLNSFERVPTARERFGTFWKFDGGHGKFWGATIQWVGAIGILFGLFNILRLMMISAGVRGQKRKAQSSKSNPLGRVMMAYEGTKGTDAESVELAMDEAILKESPKLEFGLSFLKLGAGIAPLLGLLGTVTGMIGTFQAMMIYGAGDPKLMAGGISEALVTTMLGLVVAIPLLILHSFCSSMARGVQSTLEEQSAGIVARHVESGRSV